MAKTNTWKVTTDSLSLAQLKILSQEIKFIYKAKLFFLQSKLWTIDHADSSSTPNKNLKATLWCKWTLCDPWVWQILSRFYTDRYLYEPPRNTSYKITVIAWYIWEKTGRAQRANNELRLIPIFCPLTQDHLVMNTFLDVVQTCVKRLWKI